MCIAQTAKRRRRQAKNNYRHLGPLVRPKFSKISAEKSANREFQKKMTEARMKQKKKK